MSRLAEPRLVRVAPQDNVATVVNDGGLRKGTQITAGLGVGSVTLVQDVPEAHKVALVSIDLLQRWAARRA